ncbi:hypothetical protein MMC24_003055 [Lignoscripta atroalba]|nr:hypothetical protein [Lignoscripta atroalba]
MIRLLLSRPKASLNHSALLLSTGLLAYGFHNKKSSLRCDSISDIPWPPSRNVAIGQGAKEGHQRPTTEKASASSSTSLTIPPENDGTPPLDDNTTTWASFSSTFANAGLSVGSIEWSTIGDSITNYIIPDWAKALPGYITKLQVEMEMGPGSLADEIWREADDADINPEIRWDASVRVGKDLCVEEQVFRMRRRQYVTHALARYLDIPQEDVDPEDVPTIAMCGSGGGLRALVAGTGSYLSAQEAGLFDCVTYTGGVSGSCWLQTLYNSSLGRQRHETMVEHLKKRIGIHIAFPLAALGLLTTAPTNKFLLSGLVEKIKSDPEGDFGLVDVYGLLLAARLLIPRGELEVDDRDLKVSNQRAYVDKGANPLPIYTAVRHEIPLDEKKSDEEKAQGGASEETKEKAKQEAWFQWFEFTPYELWCEELDAGIPTWSIGRQFQKGRNVPLENGLGLPELRVPLLMGIWGSAFCATLSHYYKEIRPVVKGLAGFGGIDELIEERNNDLVKVHPIGPASIPNYALGLEDRLPPTCPKSIFSASHLQLMDAGMSNNLPIYPFLRPGRDVDILIAFDASADIKTENWLSVADGYAKQRGVKGWPIGTGWPQAEISQTETNRELEAAQAATPQEAASRIAEAREEQREKDNTTLQSVSKSKHIDPKDADLGYCTVWIGTTEERSSTTEPPQSKRLNAEADWQLLEPNAGIAVIYFPFLPNPKVKGVDPNTSDFMSTWNFVYTPDEIDKVVALARANFEEGKEQTKRCVRAVYERKRKKRLEREERESIKRWGRVVREHGDHFR